MNLKKIFLLCLGVFIFFVFSYLIFIRFYFHDFFYEVPNLVGMTKIEAKKMLEKNNLEMKYMGEQYAHLPEGQVFLQEPKPSSVVKSGRRIQIWISKGENLVEIPELVGINFLTAKSLVEQQGLIVDKINYLPKDIPYNEVIATDPNLKKPIAKGSKISFLISGRGKEVALNLKVPDIIGYPLEDAKQVLLSEDLKVGKISYKNIVDMEPNIVLETGIPVGRSIETNTKIDLVVSQ